MSLNLRDLFVQQFKLCKLLPTERVGVLCEMGRKTEYVEAAVGAAQAIGASAVVLAASRLSHASLPPVDADSRDVPPLIAGAAECDMIVDATVGGLIHSDVRTRITGKGKRMLFVHEPAEVLSRLMGSDEIRRRVERAGEQLKKGKTLHISSEAGTNLTADISGEDLPITRQWGYVDEPGRWDHWPSGFVACFPKDKTAEGSIVLQPGDVLLPWGRYVRELVGLTVRGGFITEIKGDGADAFVLREYFDQWGDQAALATSHMGWGVHPNASWSALNVYDPRTLYGQELRSTEGNFMWSTGSNRFANRETPAHLDIPMRGCTIEVDGEAVVRQGRLVS